MHIILNLNSNVCQLFYIYKIFKMTIRYQIKFRLRDFFIDNYS